MTPVRERKNQIGLKIPQLMKKVKTLQKKSGSLMKGP
jgi:hypothetical protein